jgi:hypothetical protein
LCSNLDLLFANNVMSVYYGLHILLPDTSVALSAPDLFWGFDSDWSDVDPIRTASLRESSLVVHSLIAR